jgi:NAD(P)H-hydrate epimerase
VVHHSHALTKESGRAELAEAVASQDTDPLDRRMAALVAYARKLTRTPAAMREADVAALRQAGLDDRAIVDVNQVVAYFNYVNRVVEGLGVQLEERWPATVRSRRRYVPDQVGDQIGAGIPTLDPAALPWLSVGQMREVDRLLIEELGIALEQLMENAGRNLALLARLLLGGEAHGRAVVVLAGPGGNGGGAMVAARHLAVAGAQVRVLLGAPPKRLAPVPAHQHDILRRMGLDVQVGGAALGPADLVLDGLLGYSQAGPPHGGAARLLEATAGQRVLALDVPSGLELATGKLHTPHVVAEATMTLAAPKQALRAPGAAGAVGALYLADISVPPLVWERLGLARPSPFGTHTIARIHSVLDASVR